MAGGRLVFWLWLCGTLLISAYIQSLRLVRAEARLQAAEARLERCAADLGAERGFRAREEKALEAYDQNRGLAEPDAARRRLRDGSFLLGPAAGP